MKIHTTLFHHFGWAVGLSLLLGAGASAATSFSNSLTGFTGDSTQPATQAAVGAAGFNFFSTEGLDEIDFLSDPTVTFDATGAIFGSLFGGDGGRNYIRTNESDYATVNFIAEVTVVVPDLAGMDIFLGLGTGDTALFGFPDWSTQFSSVLVLPEIDNMGIAKLTTFKTQNDMNEFAATLVPTMTNGTHRVQLAFDATAKTAIFSIDLDYAGGAFVADATATTVDVSALYAVDGWPSESSRVYFGGDDSATFKDFSVEVTTAGVPGDFDDDGDVDGNDFLAWQRGDSPNGTPGGPVSAADLATWQGAYGGPLVAAVSVPEPTTALLLVLGFLGMRRLGRKG